MLAWLLPQGAVGCASSALRRSRGGDLGGDPTRAIRPRQWIALFPRHDDDGPDFQGGMLAEATIIRALVDGT
jgi:hypothetical protein